MQIPESPVQLSHRPNPSARISAKKEESVQCLKRIAATDRGARNMDTTIVDEWLEPWVRANNVNGINDREDKHFNSSIEFLNLGTLNPMGFRMDRCLPRSLIMGMLLLKGVDANDIFDPTKIVEEKQATAAELMNHVKAGDVEWFTNTGYDILEKIISCANKFAVENDISDPNTHITPEFSNIGALSHLAFDIVQELEVARRSTCQGARYKATLEQRYGEDWFSKTQDIFDRSNVSAEFFLINKQSKELARYAMGNCVGMDSNDYGHFIMQLGASVGTQKMKDLQTASDKSFVDTVKGHDYVGDGYIATEALYETDNKLADFVNIKGYRNLAMELMTKPMSQIANLTVSDNGREATFVSDSQQPQVSQNPQNVQQPQDPQSQAAPMGLGK